MELEEAARKKWHSSKRKIFDALKKKTIKKEKKNTKSLHQKEEESLVRKMTTQVTHAYSAMNCFLTQQVVKDDIIFNWQSARHEECSWYEQSGVFIRNFCGMVTDKVKVIFF